MNTSSQSAVNIEATTVSTPKEPADVSQSLVKTWLQTLGNRQSSNEEAQNATMAGLAENAGLAGLPESMQAQLLQDRFRQAFDENGRGGAVLDGLAEEEGDGSMPIENGLEQRIARQEDADDELSGESEARATVAERSGQNAAGESAEGWSIDEQDQDESEIVEDVGGEDFAVQLARPTEHSIGHGANAAEPPAAPRDATDYRWIEKFTDRVLIEVEARSADRNVSIQLAQDLIPNAVLTLNRANGRWQLKAETTDDAAADGIHDAEAVLLARFAARGLGDIDVNVSRNGVSEYA